MLKKPYANRLEYNNDRRWSLNRDYSIKKRIYGIAL